MGVGERIREARNAKKLGQVAMAEKMGYSQSVISDWERGRLEPTLAALRAVSEVLGVPVWWLLEEEAPDGAEPAPDLSPATVSDLQRVEAKLDRVLSLLEARVGAAPKAKTRQSEEVRADLLHREGGKARASEGQSELGYEIGG